MRFFEDQPGSIGEPAAMADLGVHEFPGRQSEIFHIDFAQLDFSLEGRTIYIYYLRQVHQYPYCWELRDHEVLKIELSGGFKYFLFSPLLGK